MCVWQKGVPQSMQRLPLELERLVLRVDLEVVELGPRELTARLPLVLNKA